MIYQDIVRVKGVGVGRLHDLVAVELMSFKTITRAHSDGMLKI